MTEFAQQDATTKLTEPSALSGHYLREFSNAIALMDDFQAFIEALKLVVGEDPFLEAEAVLNDPTAKAASEILPDFNALETSETLVSVTGEAGHLGYLKLRGRRDSKPFGAEDMHLMGSIAGFISALTLQARKFRQSAEAERVLKYLINQLPLGVVCLNSKYELIVESNLAAKTLGESGLDALLAMVRAKNAFVRGRMQGHLEVEDRLVYTEARQLKMSSDFEVTAFVLYDLSNYREKFCTELELEAYRSHSRDRLLTLALVKQDGPPGAGYREMMSVAEKMQRTDMRIRPLDAYSTACIFSGQGPRSVRSIFSSMLGPAEGEIELGLLPIEGPLEAARSAISFIDRAKEKLLPLREAVLPELIVFDAYPGVYDALQLITSELCKLNKVSEFEEAVGLVRSGHYDGLFMDIDCLQDAQIHVLKREVKRADRGFKVFFCSYQKPEMVRQREGVDPRETILCKPFYAQEIINLVTDQFNLA